MLPYQRFIFLIINGVVLAWLLKVFIWDSSSDAVGLLSVIVIGCLLLYAFYFAIVVHYSNRKESEARGDKAKFLLFALLPFLALWGFTI